MICIYRKDSGEIKMTCDELPIYDKEIFSHKTLNLSEVKKEEFINAERRYIKDGKLELTPKQKTNKEKLETMSDELKILKEGEFTKEQLLDKLINIIDLIQ